MITGYMNARDEAIVVLTLSNEEGETADIECVIDTGFTEYLALSHRVIRELGLRQAGEEEVALADGSATVLALYTVGVLWNEEERTVTAYAVDGNCLIGMKQLRGSLLTLEIIRDGLVSIEPAE